MDKIVEIMVKKNYPFFLGGGVKIKKMAMFIASELSTKAFNINILIYNVKILYLI